MSAKTIKDLRKFMGFNNEEDIKDDMTNQSSSSSADNNPLPNTREQQMLKIMQDTGLKPDGGIINGQPQGISPASPKTNSSSSSEPSAAPVSFNPYDNEQFKKLVWMRMMSNNKA